MLNLNNDYDAIEYLVYGSSCQPENITREDWLFAVANEMWCELFYGVGISKSWQKQLMLKAVDGIAFNTYLRAYSDKKGNVSFCGNYKSCYYAIMPKSKNLLMVYIQNLDTGNKKIQYIKENIIDEAIKNNSRISLQYI